MKRSSKFDINVIMCNLRKQQVTDVLCVHNLDQICGGDFFCWILWGTILMDADDNRHPKHGFLIVLRPALSVLSHSVFVSSNLIIIRYMRHGNDVGENRKHFEAHVVAFVLHVNAGVFRIQTCEFINRVKTKLPFSDFELRFSWNRSTT